MLQYLDDETLTDNMDDGVAARVLQVLERVEKQSPADFDHQLHVARLLNRISSDPLNQDLVNKVISRMEARYGQAQKQC